MWIKTRKAEVSDSFWKRWNVFGRTYSTFLRFLSRKHTFLPRETYVSRLENVRFSIGERRKCGERILSSPGDFRVFS